MFKIENQEISGAKYRIIKTSSRGVLVEQVIQEALNTLEHELNKLNSNFTKLNITLIGSPNLVITPGRETTIIYYVTVTQAMLISVVQE